jgi:uncharacterized protein (UPF0303 family)
VTAREDDLAAIAAQERELHFTRFDEDAAWRVGSRLRELAASRKLVLAIDIRRFGHPLFYAALAGSTPDQRRVDTPQEQSGGEISSEL